MAHVVEGVRKACVDVVDVVAKTIATVSKCRAVWHGAKIPYGSGGRCDAANRGARSDAGARDDGTRRNDVKIPDEDGGRLDAAKGTRDTNLPYETSAHLVASAWDAHHRRRGSPHPRWRLWASKLGGKWLA